MSLTALFPQLRGFHLEQVRADADGLTVVATATQRTVLCPHPPPFPPDMTIRFPSFPSLSPGGTETLPANSQEGFPLSCGRVRPLIRATLVETPPLPVASSPPPDRAAVPLLPPSRCRDLLI